MNPTIAPIITRVSRWPGVETRSSPEGATFRDAEGDLARLPASGDLVVSTRPVLRNQLLTDGFADRVPGRADRVRYRIRSAADVPGAIRLLRIAYLDRTAGGGPPATLDTHLRRLGASRELVALLVDPGRRTTDGRFA
jgi:hypothetical protein